MSLISKLKSLLGGTSGQDGGGAVVTVEPEPRTETERAVKETPPPAGTAGADGDGSTTASTSAAEPTDNGESVPSTGDGASGSDEATDATSNDDGEVLAEDEARASEPAETNDDPVDTLSGIGPAYATRLGAAGVETVGDLLAADVSALAAETDLGEGQLTNWVAQAEDA